jgi:hypothetical protein
MALTVVMAFLLGVYSLPPTVQASDSPATIDSDVSTFQDQERSGGNGGVWSGTGEDDDGTRNADPDWPTPGNVTVEREIVAPRLVVPIYGPFGTVLNWMLSQVSVEFLDFRR